MAAYPTSYEFPYCPECKTPQGRHGQRAGLHSEHPAARPNQISFKMVEHFPERDYNLECQENLNKAKDELHLFDVHGDKRYESRVMANRAIVVRKGRLKP